MAYAAASCWALQWDDLDVRRRQAHVQRQVYEDGTIGTPKSGKPRDVDLAEMVVEALVALRAHRREEDLRPSLTYTTCPAPRIEPSDVAGLSGT